MQTTLLTFAIGLIVALVAALFGPHLVNWSDYRSQFETQASRIVGAPVRVAGNIDVRLLPSPGMRLGEITVGAGSEAIRARALAMEFALGGLMRGQLRAEELTVSGPAITLTRDAGGKAALPKLTSGQMMDRLAIDRLVVEDALVTVSDAQSGLRATFDKVSFTGELRGAATALRGEGAFVANGGLYGYRLNASRGEGGGYRIRFGLDPADIPWSGEADGLLKTENGVPQFDGSLTMTRAVTGGKQGISEPWRMTAKVRADGVRATFDQIDFQYGPDERALKLAGDATMRIGPDAGIDAKLSGRQIDLDRLIALPDAPPMPPIAAAQRIADMMLQKARTGFPVRAAISADSVTLGGAPLQNLRGEFVSARDGLTLERLELRAPGMTDVSLAGKIDTRDQGVSFAGKAEVNALDARLLFGWLEARDENVPGAARALRAKGDVAVSREKFALENFAAEIDRKTVQGRVAYSFERADKPARLDADLKAAEIDADGLIAFANAAFAGSSLARPRELSVTAEIGQVTYAGVQARNVTGRVAVDASVLQLERLVAADVGGARVEANGRVDLAGSPRGQLTLGVDAREIAGLQTLLARYAPNAAKALDNATRAGGRTALRGTLDMQPLDRAGVTLTNAALKLDGSLGALRLKGDSQATGTLAEWPKAELRMTGTLDGDDGAMLVGALGLGDVVSVGAGSGEFKISLNGPADKLDIGLRVKANGLNAESHGRGSIAPDGTFAAQSTIEIRQLDARKLRMPRFVDSGKPLPVTLNSKIALNAGAMTLDDINATVAGSRVSGRVALNRDAGSIDGALTVAVLPLGDLAGGVTGLAPRQEAAWPLAAYDTGRFWPLSGRVTLQAPRAEITPDLALTDLRANIVLSPSHIALEDLQGKIAGGDASGRVEVRQGADGLTARGMMKLTGVNAAPLNPAGGNGITGKLNLALEAEGAGASPRALIASLSGNGSATLQNARIAALNPGVFTASARAIDQGMAIDLEKVRGFATQSLAEGDLALGNAEIALSLASGQLRFGTLSAAATGTEFYATGSADLVSSALDARLQMIGANAGNAGKPELSVTLTGPWRNPARNLDIGAFTGWLALRAVDDQQRKIEAIEKERRTRAPAPSSGQALAAEPSPSLAPALPAPIEVAPAARQSPSRPRERNTAPTDTRTRSPLDILIGTPQR